MDPRALGVKDEEIIPLNLDLSDKAKEIKRLYWEVVKTGKYNVDEFSLALKNWRESGS